MNVHIGSSSKMVITADDAPMSVLITLSPINIVQAAADFVWSSAAQKFPKLKYALSEGGIGWIPYFRERIDYTFDRHRYWTGQDMGDRLPSQVFDEQVICCWIDDPVGIEMRHKMNIDMICWECDYPHSDSTWPQSPEQFMKQMQAAHCSDEDIDKISHANAMRLYNYDPFSMLGTGELHRRRAARAGRRLGHEHRRPRHQGDRHRRDGPAQPRVGWEGQVGANSTGSARVVPQPGHQTFVPQCPERALLGRVDHHRVARFTVDDERHHAVVAGVGARHHTVATADGSHRDPRHARILTPGCDNEGFGDNRRP